MSILINPFSLHFYVGVMELSHCLHYLCSACKTGRKIASIWEVGYLSASKSYILTDREKTVEFVTNSEGQLCKSADVAGKVIILH